MCDLQFGTLPISALSWATSEQASPLPNFWLFLIFATSGGREGRGLAKTPDLPGAPFGTTYWRCLLAHTTWGSPAWAHSWTFATSVTMWHWGSPFPQSLPSVPLSLLCCAWWEPTSGSGYESEEAGSAPGQPQEAILSVAPGNGPALGLLRAHS